MSVTRSSPAMLLLLATTASLGGAQETERALAVEREVRRIAAERALWPGFEPLEVPLAVFTGDATYLFRHPAPPEGFGALAGSDLPTFVFVGRHPAVVANSVADFGGALTATVLATESSRGEDPTELASVALHEAFHVFQRQRYATWSANEGDLFLYPFEDARLLTLRRLESAALGRAFVSSEPPRQGCWARVALEHREGRFGGMDAAFATYERRTELHEGLATYIQLSALGTDHVEIPASGFAASDVRGRSYVTGAALALLLDRWLPGWTARLGEAEEPALDLLLRAALEPDPDGEPSACDFEVDQVARITESARQDAEAVLADRGIRRERFDALPGWRVLVHAAEGRPLWPQGFDPLNVARIEGGILHTRFLRLGNDSGELEAVAGSGIALEALTEGAGSHPLSQGIRTVTVAGLPEPELEEGEGRVLVRTPGFSARFENAVVGVEGAEIRIQLRPPG